MDSASAGRSRRWYWGGRHDQALDDVDVEFTIRRVPLDRGGYTRSGEYFGTGAPLWLVIGEPVDSSLPGLIEFHLRAANHKAALAEVKWMYPKSTLYRKASRRSR